jgi:sodium/potassium-transporting ATPase subunit alpha
VGDPMEVALLDFARRVLPDVSEGTRIDEIPFDAERMRMLVTYATQDGRTLYCKGAPEGVLPLCSRVSTRTGDVPFNNAARARVRGVQDAMTEQGLRVLAMAHRHEAAAHGPDLPEGDLVFAGLVGLEDPPRSGVPHAMAQCRTAGIKVIMVTGDHPRTACALAREVGLVQTAHPTVVTGDQLRNLSGAELHIILDAEDLIFARVAADQKLRIVQALKEKQQIVAVTGDGVNDAPALKSAHIGVAMGIAGTDVAKEAADMVLLDDNFASIVSAVEEGRAIFQKHSPVSYLYPRPQRAGARPVHGLCPVSNPVGPHAALEPRG